MRPGYTILGQSKLIWDPSEDTLMSCFYRSISREAEAFELFSKLPLLHHRCALVLDPAKM